MTTHHHPAAVPFVENVPAAAARVLDYVNWTGHTLAQLINAGRVLRSDKKTIRDFVRAALGDAPTIEGVRAQILIAEYITNHSQP